MQMPPISAKKSRMVKVVPNNGVIAIATTETVTIRISNQCVEYFFTSGPVQRAAIADAPLAAPINHPIVLPWIPTCSLSHTT